jgi:hypothetical protein
MTNGESQEVDVAPSKHTITLKFRALKNHAYSVDLEGSKDEDDNGEPVNAYLAQLAQEQPDAM